jgi:hypothetical protein
MARSFKSRSGSHRLEEAEFTLVQAGWI